MTRAVKISILLLVALACCSTASAQIVASPSLGVARSGHRATRLHDGRVLVAGGENATGMLPSAELYDPILRRFSVTGSLNVPRAEHRATLLSDGRVLITGGERRTIRHGETTAATPTMSTELFDAGSGTFSAGPSMVVARSGHTATVLTDGRILIAGGDARGSAELFDPVSFTFTALTGGLTAPRWFAGAALLPDGRVLIVGGADAGGAPLRSVEVFTPGTSSFTHLSSTLEVAREAPFLRALPDGKVLIVGGSQDSTIELFDPIFDPAGPTIRASARVLNTSNTLADILRSRTRAALIHLLDPHDALLQSQLTKGLRALLERTGHSVTELGESRQALVAGGVDWSGRFLSTAHVVGSSAATVTTDRSDYPPGTIVEISGTEWQAGETVLISMHEEPGPANVRPAGNADTVYSAVAGVDGRFLNIDFTPDVSDLGRTFTITAVGQSSGFVAQTTFTDGTCITGTAAPEAPASAVAGTPTVPILSFTVSCSKVSATLQSAQMTYTGTTAADITRLSIYRERGTTPGFQPSEDLLVGSVKITKSGTNAPLDTLTATGNNVVGSAGAKFYVAVDVKPGASSGHTVGLKIARTKIRFSDGAWPPGELAPSGSTTITAATSTTVARTAGSGPSVFGQSLTFQATVTQTAGGASVGANGSVTFTDGAGGATLCRTVLLNASGQATCTTSSLAVGVHQIVAAYSGAGSFGSSDNRSTPFSQTVNKAGTSISVMSSQNPSVFAQIVTFTASVSVVAPGAGVPDGTVSFTANGSTIAGCSALTFTGGSATCATDGLGVDGSPYLISVTYSGSNDYTAGSPGTLTGAQTVTKANQTIVWSNPADASYGTALSATQLNAIVNVPGPGPAGALTYSPLAGTLLNAGSAQTLSVTATATANYNAATKTVSINVLKATPVLAWSNPADITYPTALSATQLNATASANGSPLPGVFTYTPAAGTVLNAGAGQNLHVDFAPTDAVNFTTAARDVSLNVAPGVVVTITDPVAGSTVSAGQVLVQGTVQAGGQDVGVFVNGVAATLQGSRFTAVVFVGAGTTTLTASATTATGAIANDSVTIGVPSSADSGMQLVASPGSGVAPLTVSFSLRGAPANAAIELDVDGDGTIDFAGASLEGQTFTYAQPGFYFPVATVTDPSGVRVPVTGTVMVQSPAVITAWFQSIWTSFKARLVAADVTGALTYLSPAIHTEFGQVFQVLGSDLPAVGASLEDLFVVEQFDDLAETAIVRQEDLASFLYFIYFRRDGLGRWLIEEM